MGFLAEAVAAVAAAAIGWMALSIWHTRQDLPWRRRFTIAALFLCAVLVLAPGSRAGWAWVVGPGILGAGALATSLPRGATVVLAHGSRAVLAGGLGVLIGRALTHQAGVEVVVARVAMLGVVAVVLVALEAVSPRAHRPSGPMLEFGQGTERPALAGPVRVSGVELLPGSVVSGRYVIEEHLGEGAAGLTYLARDRQAADRAVVVKALRGSPTIRDDALREARAVQSVRSARVVELLDVVDGGRAAFLVFEYVQGGSLDRALDEGGALDPDRWWRIASDLCEALEAAHAAGVVHRDVKPSNVLLTGEGRAKLGDFGVASTEGADATLTPTVGALAVGTVRFMSPEQAAGVRASERSDQYGLAATLYEAALGTPFRMLVDGGSPSELQRAVADGSWRPQLEVLPAPLQAWFGRALAFEPSERFEDVAEMSAALGALDSGRVATDQDQG